MDREPHRLDVDLGPHLNGNVVTAGLHLRNLDDNLFRGLVNERGFVIILIVRQEYPGNRVLSQILPRQSYAVVHFACCGVHACYLRRALPEAERSEEDHHEQNSQANKHPLAAKERSFRSRAPRSRWRAETRTTGWDLSHLATSVRLQSYDLRKTYARHSVASSRDAHASTSVARWQLGLKTSTINACYAHSSTHAVTTLFL